MVKPQLQPFASISRSVLLDESVWANSPVYVKDFTGLTSFNPNLLSNCQRTDKNQIKSDLIPLLIRVFETHFTETKKKLFGGRIPPTAKAVGLLRFLA